MLISTCALLFPFSASTTSLHEPAFLGGSSFTVHVVDPTPGAGDFTSISGALASPLVRDGDTVRVNAGTYFETLVVDKAIWLVSSDGPAATTIDGSASGTVLTVEAGATVEGFSITDGGGPTTNCGGVRITSTDPVMLVGNVIHDNHPHGDAGVPAGGISIFHGARVRMVANDIHSNTSLSVGGMFAHAFSTIDVIDTTIRGNGGTSTPEGGLTTTGGVLCGASGRFVNTRITGNLGTAIGGFYFAGALGDGPLGAEVDVVNCTIAGNLGSAPVGSVGGVFLGDGGDIEIVNSIVYFNTGATASNLGLDDAFDGGMDDTGELAISYSHTTPLPPAVVPGPGMLTFGPAPSFVAPAPASPFAPSMFGDYHLMPMSPDVGAGSIAAYPKDASAGDLGGVLRVLGAGIEMGAYELGTSCDAPEHYGFGKISSLAELPRLAASGDPSVSGGGFALVLTHGVPSKGCVLVYGSVRAHVPYAEATLYTARPVVRASTATMDGSGNATFPVTLSPGMAGTTRHYQVILHDPAQPDGTRRALSNAVTVTFCD